MFNQYYFKDSFIIADISKSEMQKSNKYLALSNSLQNMLFPPGKYTSHQLLNLTPYFTASLSLQKHKQMMNKIFETDEEKLWWVVRAENAEVDAKALLIVLMLQLLGREKRQMTGFNQNAKFGSSSGTNNNQHIGNLTSPRSKTTRALYISNEQTLILNYIKQNLINFLRLLSNEPQNQDPYLSAQELQPLNILFKVDKNKQFSSYMQIFNKSQKLKASTISEHLSHRINITDTELVSLQGHSFSVIMKEQAQCRGKDLRIIGCEDSQIFIESSVRSLYIVNCVNCTIYVAACQKIAFIDKCQKLSLTIATNLLRICNTVDSNIYYYGPSPVVLTGDNRSVALGPNNSPSPQLKDFIKDANIQLSNQYFKTFEQVLYKSVNSNFYYPMKPADFDLLVLPDKSQEQQTSQQKGLTATIAKSLLAPAEYIKQLEERNAYYISFKSKIAKSNMTPEMSNHLHSAYQGHFKQWLIAKDTPKI